MFRVRTDGVVFRGTVFVPEDIIDYEEYDSLKITGKGEEDFIVSKKIREISRKDRKAYIQSFSSDVGILNIIRKIKETGSDFPVAVHTDELKDLSKIPDNFDEAAEAIKAGDTAWHDLPDSLKKGRSREDFINSISQDEIKSYIDKIVSEHLKDSQKKEGE